MRLLGNNPRKSAVLWGSRRTIGSPYKVSVSGGGSLHAADSTDPQNPSGHHISRRLTCAPRANADDMLSFATGGYARGLRTMSEMHKIDTDGDGTVSHDEFIAYQTKVFEMMDANKSGVVGPQAFLGK
jgi:hypothetical protein